MEIPNEMLQKLLSIDWTPEELEKLQGFLDFAFSMMPKEQSQEQ
jgi:hypothetical protein